MLNRIKSAQAGKKKVTLELEVEDWQGHVAVVAQTIIIGKKRFRTNLN